VWRFFKNRFCKEVEKIKQMVIVFKKSTGDQEITGDMALYLGECL